MRRNAIINLGLFAVVVVLALVAYLEPGRERPAEKIPLTGLAPEAINFIRIRDDRGRDLVMEKRPEGWWMTRPYNRPADEQRIGQLLGIATTRSFSRFPMAGKRLAEFGLDPPLVHLQLNDIKLEIGGNEPVQFRRYVRIGDRLHLISNGYHHHLMARADDFVQKRAAP